MINNFGKYISRYSLVHRFDGRLKFVSYILLLTAIFLKNDFIPYFILLAFLFLLFFLAHLPKRLLWTIFKTIFILLVFLFLFNLVNLNPEQVEHAHHAENAEHAKKTTVTNVIWSWSFLELSYSGIVLTFYYSLRVFLVIFLTVILISTTKPKVLTLSIESLLKPLQKIRFPVHIFAMIISLTLRLVPTLIEEANNILLAQASRGLDFHNSHFRKKIKCLISLLIPLIISIFKRADEMATAMESRGYNPYKKRTKYHQFFLSKINIVLFAVVLAIFCTILVYLFFLPHPTTSFILNTYLHLVH